MTLSSVFVRRREQSVTEGSLLRDLPFDGSPSERTIRSSLDGTPLHVYRWRRNRNMHFRGVLLLLHGVRAHVRLTWLAKRPPELDHLPLPTSVVPEFLPKSEVWKTCHLCDKEGSSFCPSCAELVEAAFAESSLEEAETKMLPEDFTSSSPSSSESTVDSLSFSTCLSFSNASDEQRQTHLFYEGSWIEAFNMLGYEVFGTDLRGHGKSGGDRCTVNEFDDYCSDVRDIIEQVIWTSYPARDVKLNVIGVSLSTLVLCKLLQDPSSENLSINACALISGFLKEGEKFQRSYLRTLIKLIAKLRNVVPRMPVVIPKKPETQGPSWQMRFGESDPYLIRDFFTVKVRRWRYYVCSQMVGSCIVALDDFNQKRQALLDNRACSRILMLHNYLDCVNPIDGSMEPISWLMTNSKDIDIQCVVFNGQYATEEQQRAWHPNVYLDRTPLDLSHTMITDRDNVNVFKHLIRWLNSV